MSVKREKIASYRFLVGQQFFPDPEEVFAELSQAFNEALLQFVFFLRGKTKTEREESYCLFTQLTREQINIQVNTKREGGKRKETRFFRSVVAEVWCASWKTSVDI